MIEIWCPECGLKSENYLTEYMLEIAIKMFKNVTMDILFKKMEKFEHQFKGGGLTFNVSKKPKQKLENAIVSGIDSRNIHFHFYIVHLYSSISVKPVISYFISLHS
ncbi:hypothetical protein [Clostridium tagluense]|uniref:Uncharacterized protein n=1 Tax=Clostridium tagluense TaxID=360422 RepID=A0A401UI06_9CLOT|nr:hypothetical protein [Clostridium tagluense]GCD09175.1 hypothetical protein Ctaglu_07980 [Clostridium tagluense]